MQFENNSIHQKNYKDIQYNEQYLNDVTEGISLLSVQNKNKEIFNNTKE